MITGSFTKLVLDRYRAYAFYQIFLFFNFCQFMQVLACPSNKSLNLNNGSWPKYGIL
jgi:hypothetical protein